MFAKKLAFRWMFCGIALVLAQNPTVVDAQWTAPTAEQVYADRDRVESCPNCNHRLPKLNVYGLNGNPYFGQQQGGCRCGQKSGLTWYNGYHHWPSPMSALLDHGRNGCRTSKSADTRNPKLRDKLDCLASFRLLAPVRNDNGHTGRHCDPYGLLGESRRGKPLGDAMQAPRAPQYGANQAEQRNPGPANFRHPTAMRNAAVREASTETRMTPAERIWVARRQFVPDSIKAAPQATPPKDRIVLSPSAMSVAGVLADHRRAPEQVSAPVSEWQQPLVPARTAAKDQKVMLPSQMQQPSQAGIANLARSMVRQPMQSRQPANQSVLPDFRPPATINDSVPRVAQRQVDVREVPMRANGDTTLPSSRVSGPARLR